MDLPERDGAGYRSSEYRLLEGGEGSKSMRVRTLADLEDCELEVLLAKMLHPAATPRSDDEARVAPGHSAAAGDVSGPAGKANEPQGSAQAWKGAKASGRARALSAEGHVLFRAHVGRSEAHAKHFRGAELGDGAGTESGKQAWAVGSKEKENRRVVGTPHRSNSSNVGAAAADGQVPVSGPRGHGCGVSKQRRAVAADRAERRHSRTIQGQSDARDGHARITGGAAEASGGASGASTGSGTGSGTGEPSGAVRSGADGTPRFDPSKASTSRRNNRWRRRRDVQGIGPHGGAPASAASAAKASLGSDKAEPSPLLFLETGTYIHNLPDHGPVGERRS